MKTVFADTFYFLALLNPSDQAHARAVEFTSRNAVRMMTTDWVLTELADGLAGSPRAVPSSLVRWKTCKPMRTRPSSRAIPP